MSAAKSLAANVRGVTDSEEFDLGGYEGQQIVDLVSSVSSRRGGRWRWVLAHGDG